MVLVPKTKRKSRAAAGARARVATFPLLRNAINPSSLYVHVFVTSRVVSHFDTNPVEYDNTTTPVKVKVGLFGEEEATIGELAVAQLKIVTQLPIAWQ